MQRALSLAAGLICLISFVTLFIPQVRDGGLATGLDTALHVGNVIETSYLLSGGPCGRASEGDPSGAPGRSMKP